MGAGQWLQGGPGMCTVMDDSSHQEGLFDKKNKRGTVAGYRSHKTLSQSFLWPQ